MSILSPLYLLPSSLHKHASRPFSPPLCKYITKLEYYYLRKMLMKPFYLLLVSSWLFEIAEGSISQIDCYGKKGKKTTEQTWNCDSDGSATCSEFSDDCSSCGNTGNLLSGRTTYQANGLTTAVGGGWDCRRKCSYGRGSSGSQSNTSSKNCSRGGSRQTKRRPANNSGFGSQSGPCKYDCSPSGSCTVTYTGPRRAGRTSGSCFPRSYGGSCNGTPAECQNCNTVLSCS